MEYCVYYVTPDGEKAMNCRVRKIRRRMLAQGLRKVRKRKHLRIYKDKIRSDSDVRES